MQATILRHLYIVMEEMTLWKILVEVWVNLCRSQQQTEEMEKWRRRLNIEESGKLSAHYAKMTILIYSIIVMCLYSVYLVCLVLKSTYFKEHLPVVQRLLSNIVYATQKTMQRNLNYKCVQFLIVPMKDCFSKWYWSK